MGASRNSRERFAEAVARCWPKAQEHWSRFLLLSDPVDDSKQPSVAQIHLGTRQVSVHFEQILEKGLIDSLEAILAHEVGHHVRYPGSLAVDARMRLLERSLIPIEGYSLINLFTDLMINERLGRDLRDQLIRVYQAFTVEVDWKRDPAFLFYLAVYEELWRLDPGTLMGPARPEFERVYPDYRAEAQVLGQDLFPLGPNLYTQFLYFVSVLSGYLQPQTGETPEAMDPYRCGCADPSDEDWADALTPGGRELEAIRRAVREGWITPEQGELMGGAEALEERIAGLPGTGTAEAERVPEIMAAYYRRQAERFLLRPPPQRTLGEAIVPTTLEEWEPGDPAREVDWLATLIQRGDVLGAVEPVKRTKLAEHEGYDVPLWQPRVEIYLDVSGSMPDPRTTLNALTLAAQILGVGAIRAGGWARALLYSSGHVDYWQWCRSEVELSRFLMHYIGGGTDFPFDRLRDSVEECRGRQPIRVVITDRDFDVNYRADAKNARIVRDSARESAQLLLLLHEPDPAQAARYRAEGATVVPVAELSDFPRMAADLARALFSEPNRGTD